MPTTNPEKENVCFKNDFSERREYFYGVKEWFIQEFQFSLYNFT